MRRHICWITLFAVLNAACASKTPPPAAAPPLQPDPAERTAAPSHQPTTIARWTVESGNGPPQPLVSIYDDGLVRWSGDIPVGNAAVHEARLSGPQLELLTQRLRRLVHGLEGENHALPSPPRPSYHRFTIALAEGQEVSLWTAVHHSEPPSADASPAPVTPANGASRFEQLARLSQEEIARRIVILELEAELLRAVGHAASSWPGTVSPEAAAASQRPVRLLPWGRRGGFAEWTFDPWDGPKEQLITLYEDGLVKWSGDLLEASEEGIHQARLSKPQLELLKDNLHRSIEGLEGMSDAFRMTLRSPSHRFVVALPGRERTSLMSSFRYRELVGYDGPLVQGAAVRGEGVYRQLKLSRVEQLSRVRKEDSVRRIVFLELETQFLHAVVQAVSSVSEDERSDEPSPTRPRPPRQTTQWPLEQGL